MLALAGVAPPVITADYELGRERGIGALRRSLPDP